MKGKSNWAYYFSVNCLNDLLTAQARNRHYEYCSSDNHVKVEIPFEKWLKFHDGQYQFKGPFMLPAGFQSILKPVNEQFREKRNKLTTER